MAAPTGVRSRTRIEYLGFRNIDASREYRYAVHSSDGSCEFRLLIALAAFAKAQVLIQDGPDVCYQQLVRDLDGGDNIEPGPRSVADADLRAYHDAHHPTPRRLALANVVPATPATTEPAVKGASS